jgi:hypothetical protein
VYDVRNLTSPREELHLDFDVFYPIERIQIARSNTLSVKFVKKIVGLKHDS